MSATTSDRHGPGHPPARAPAGYLDRIRWGHRTPVYRALGFTFTMQTTDARVGRHVERLWSAFDRGERPQAVYSLIDRGPGAARRWLGYIDADRVAYTDDAGVALGYFLWHVNRGVVEHTPGCALLHAAGAEYRGQGLVLPAKMEAGKTTTVAGLVRRGMRYLSDEVVAVEPDTLALRPYPKALSIDPGSWEVLADLAPAVEPALAPYVSAQWHVQPAQVWPDAIAGVTRPRYLVAPRYVAGAETVLTPVSRADMLQRLVRCTFDFSAGARWKLDALAALTSACDCYELTIGDLGRACDLIFGLFHDDQGYRHR